MNLILIIWFVIAVKILQFSDEWGTKIQLNSPGYLANKRQHRFCGLAILELAQALHSFWHKSKVCTVLITLQKLMSCITNSTQKKESGTDSNTFSWRDLYNIPVKWRQISEVAFQLCSVSTNL